MNEQTYEARMRAKAAERDRERDQNLGEAIKRACADLPDGYLLHVVVEGGPSGRGGATVEVFEVEETEQLTVSHDYDELAGIVDEGVRVAKEHAAMGSGTGEGAAS